MSIEWIRENYGVPAKRNGRVKYTGDNDGPKFGTIRRANGQYLMILLDGAAYAQPFHPTWEIEYLDAAPACILDIRK